MTFRWTDEETIELIRLYKTYPLLWDSNHKLYKNAIVRTNAYKHIVEKLISKMDNPSLSVQDIRCKIKNLRSSYYQELKKIARAKKHGCIHKCTLTWFDYFKDVMSTIAHNNEQPYKEKITRVQRSDSEDSIDISEDKPLADAYVVTIKQEYLDELAKKDTKMIDIPDDYFDTITMPLPKKIKIESKYDTGEDETRGEKTQETDEFQIFANHVAEQLRNLPLDRALTVQVDIQALVAKERIELYIKKEENE